MSRNSVHLLEPPRLFAHYAARRLRPLWSTWLSAIGCASMAIAFNPLAGFLHSQDAIPVAKENSVGMQFVRLAAGEYMRGFDESNHGEHRFKMQHRFSNSQSFADEMRAHRVVLTRPFEMSRTEVTVGQFAAFTDSTGYTTDAERGGGALGCFPDEKNYVDRFHKSAEVTWKSPGFPQTDQHPVVGVSWNDARAFCGWLSKKEGVTYRLPSEAEWEYACRSGQSTWYSWGEDPDEAYVHANVADGALEAAQPDTTRYQRAVGLAEKDGDGVVFTAAVASYRPNPWGLYDMHGNVWEWCQDLWQADLYRQYFDGVPRPQWGEVLVSDPLLDEKTDQHRYGDWRVIRGGAWTCAPAAVRCSIRTFAEKADSAVYTGFRVVRDVEQN